MFLFLLLLFSVIVLLLPLLYCCYLYLRPLTLKHCDIYIISLDRSVDRKEHLKNTFKYPYYLFRGREGHPDNDTSLNVGQQGCFLSHITLLHQIANANGNKGVIICEDDVEIVGSLEIKVPKEADILFLGHILETQGEQITLTSLFYKSVYPRGTHCYYITPLGAKKILTYLGTFKPTHLPIDEVYAAMVNQNLITAYSAYPEIAWQNGKIKSTINV